MSSGYGSNDTNYMGYINILVRAIPLLVGALFLVDSMRIYNPPFLYYMTDETKIMYASLLLILCGLIFLGQHFFKKKSPY